MISNSEVEHFCTLFDSNYLPLGMALHRSLMQHALPFHLWIVCIDEAVEISLRQLALPQVSLIPLRDIETPELLSVKPQRTRGEYCWTLTPFTFTSVFARDPSVHRVTYLDADLYFLDRPSFLLDEFCRDRHILITEHGYAPKYDQTATNGRFCVQFLCARRTEAARRVLNWWQEKCIDWCFNRLEDGKFGDQKYLDLWPKLFSEEVQIVQNPEKTLAPWNVNYFSLKPGTTHPVFFHFHGFKLISPTQAQLYYNYRINSRGMEIYQKYLYEINRSKQQLLCHGIPLPYFPLEQNIRTRLHRWKYQVLKKLKFGNLTQQQVER
ncbi:MAG: hypothetical protein ACFBSG_20825 [Leptolyngbyaceae cyanobacterium]